MFDSLTEVAVFENAVREELNTTAQRRLAVLKPIKLVLTNIAPRRGGRMHRHEQPAGREPDHSPDRPHPRGVHRERRLRRGSTAEVFPPETGGEVRLKYACIIKLDEIVKDATGNITELRCTADLTTRSGKPNSDKKVKGTIHWVSATNCVEAEVRLYDRLFNVAEPDADGKFLEHVNPKSLEVVTAKLEASLAGATLADRFQFERLGYFALDPKDSTADKPIFTRTISLKDTWDKAPVKK